ncbi:MAG TPA: hypothetical protein VFV80_11965, partial [Geminicoccaceae bacterium]|nr:hypothetical protein [Geminicoccaceae bacterium]
MIVPQKMAVNLPDIEIARRVVVVKGYSYTLLLCHDTQLSAMDSWGKRTDFACCGNDWRQLALPSKSFMTTPDGRSPGSATASTGHAR